MNLSISNIAWAADADSQMYAYLKEQGYGGLEIAPTRLFPVNPYDHLSEARDLAQMLKAEYGLTISSMQSIWYGRQERVFGSKAEREALKAYTAKACRFAQAMGCKNLVFGNPRNRDTADLAASYPAATDFFHALGETALEHNTVIALEPNPPIYHTRFMNTTLQAVEMADKAHTEGIRVNLDLGTVIENGESMEDLCKAARYIHHIHISEPYLRPIDRRHEALHRQAIQLATRLGGVYVSIEMGKSELSEVQSAMAYVKGLTL